MRKYIILIFCSLFSISYAMESSWQNMTKYFEQLHNINNIDKNILSLPLVTVYKRHMGHSDFFLLLVYSDEEEDINYYEDMEDNTYKSFQNLAQNLPIKISYDYFATTKYVISCKYSNKNKNGAAESFAKLLNCLKNEIVVIYTFGENAHIVNMATRFYEQYFAKNNDFCIDLILYVQSPIYEYSWSILEQKYKYNKEWSPTCFKALYNFYTKASLPTYNIIQYPDRKYRQQVIDKSGKKNMRIKNIRMLKRNTNKRLVDMSTQEIKNFILINKITALLKECKYAINFDLVVNCYDESNEKAYPIFAINRLVQICQHALLHTYGDKKGQQYEVCSCSDIKKMKEDLTYERNISRFALTKIGKDRILNDIANRHEQGIMLEDNIYTKY